MVVVVVCNKERTGLLSLQVYADQKGYWRIRWNLFDFAILLVTVILAVMEEFHASNTILRICRTLRIVCIFRIFNHVRGLQVSAGNGSLAATHGP